MQEKVGDVTVSAKTETSEGLRGAQRSKGLSTRWHVSWVSGAGGGGVSGERFLCSLVDHYILRDVEGFGGFGEMCDSIWTSIIRQHSGCSVNNRLLRVGTGWTQEDQNSSSDR